MYRFHVKDAIYFQNSIKVTLQAMGGGSADTVKKFIQEGVPCALVSYDDGSLHGVYKAGVCAEDTKGYVNFFRQDHYRIVAYYYLAPFRL